jgi:quercetin dioxygenase-like cupin family protein
MVSVPTQFFEVPPVESIEATTPDHLFIKSMRVPKAGTVIPQHAHVWGHTTYLAKGKMRVWKGDAYVGDFTAPQTLWIEAEAKHTFQTLEDDVIALCIHNLQDANVVKILEQHELSVED